MGLFALPSGDSLKEHLVTALYNLKLMYSDKEEPYWHLKAFIKKNLEDALIHLEENKILPDSLRSNKINHVVCDFLIIEKENGNFYICNKYTKKEIFECNTYAEAETACKFHAIINLKKELKNEKG